MSTATSGNPSTEISKVLVIDDEQWVRRIVPLAFDDIGFAAGVHTVSNGKTALDYLDRTKGETPGHVLNLILLDLDLPDMHGTEVLAHLKNRAAFATIPVVIFTSSIAETDITESYERGADAYIPKPDDYDSLLQIAEELKDKWLD